MPEVLTEAKESDLDKRIALALGLKPTVTWAIFNADETALMIDFEREAAAIKWWDEHPSVHAEHHIGELEQYAPYSTNIEAAMRVAEKMRELGYRWNAQTPHGKGWEVYCYRENKRGRGDKYKGLLPEAICRAALAALGG